MRPSKTRSLFSILIAVLSSSIFLLAQASSIPASELIQPDQLVKVLQAKSGQPLVVQVGSFVLFGQAHIPGSEYAGPASTADGQQKLKQRVEKLPRDKFVVIYCGCCPWSRCPNVKPAYDLLRSMGFTHVRVLYLANNFGADWVDKGYPADRG